MVAGDAVSDSEAPFFGRGHDGELDDEKGSLPITNGGKAKAAVVRSREEFLGPQDHAEQSLLELPVGPKDEERRVGQVEAGFNLAQAPRSLTEVGEFAKDFREIDRACEGFARPAEGDETVKGLVCGGGPVLKRPKGLVSGIGVVEPGGDPEDFRYRILQFGGNAGKQLADSAEPFTSEHLLPKDTLVEQAKGDCGLIGEVGKGGFLVQVNAPAGGPVQLQNTRDRPFATHGEEQQESGATVMADRSGGGEALLDRVAPGREGHRRTAPVGGFEETGLPVGKPKAGRRPVEQAGQCRIQHLLNRGGGASGEDVFGEPLDGGDALAEAREPPVTPPPDE